VRCTACGGSMVRPPEASVSVVFINNRTYVANLHLRCLREIITPRFANHLITTTIAAGWVHGNLPEFPRPVN
jgi:hypothetical protein